jgi:glycosyltransferase involved in cell wall biosynthesis
MKRALVLTYDYPPCSAPGAALRSWKLVQYLPEFGWDVSVMCREEESAGGAEEQPAAGPEVIRIRTPVPSWLSFQLGAWMWAKRILPRARLLIRRFDLIYASCPPFPHALAAVHLAREAGIPVVVDFRDAWSLDPYLGGGRIKQAAKKFLCRWFYPRLERWVIGSADALVLNTPSMLREYVRMFRGVEQRMHLVPNGFDEGAFRERVERPSRERPLLLYCGRFAPTPGRSPDLLLRAVREAIDAGCRFEVEILGDDTETLRQSIRRFGLENSVRSRAAVSNREAVRAMRQADILVVYQAPSRNEVTPVAGKTYEYLRSSRPILAIVPQGDNADLVRRYAAVSAVVTDEDPARVAAAIQDLLGRPARATDTAPDREFVTTYDRRSIAGQIAAIFDAVRDKAVGR